MNSACNTFHLVLYFYQSLKKGFKSSFFVWFLHWSAIPFSNNADFFKPLEIISNYTSNNHRLESAGLNALEELLRCWECTEKIVKPACVFWNWMFLDILPEVVIAVLHVVEMSFDSTRGLGQPGDQSGSRRQKIILPFTLWDKLDICGRLRKLRHVFHTQSALYFSSVIVNRNLANGSFKKWEWFPEDLTSKTIISSQYNIANLKKYGLSQCPAAGQAFQNTPRPAVRILLMSS